MFSQSDIEKEIKNIGSWNKITDRQQAEIFGYDVPKRLGVIMTDEDRKTVMDLMGERTKINAKINDIYLKHDKQTAEDRTAYSKELKDFYASKDGARLKEINIALYEKCSGIDYKYAISFENKEDLYKQANETAAALSLDLNREQQAALSSYDLPTRTGEEEADGRPQVLTVSFDGVEENDRFRICYDFFLDNLDILNYIQAAKIREWPVNPIKKAVFKKAGEFYTVPKEEEKALKNQGFSIIKDTLENTTTTAPTSFITTIDKISNTLNIISKGDEEIEDEEGLLPIKVGKKGGDQIINLVKIQNLNQLDGVKVPQNITNFDREVIDAITTLNIEGQNQYITEAQVHQVLTGNKKARISPQQKEKISESFTKLMYSQITIDISNEVKAYNLKTPKGWENTTIDTPIINAKRVKHKINGTVTECLKILDTPVLYSYASIKNQIARVPIDLLNSPISKNEDSIVLQGYLIRQIEYMKGPSKRNQDLLYSTIYELLNIPYKERGTTPAKDRVKQRETREKTKTILQSFKEKGFIKEFKENNKLNRAYSITITV